MASSALPSTSSITEYQLCWGKGGNITSAGWQVTLCDVIRHVSSCSIVAIQQAAISVLLYLTLLHQTAASVSSTKQATVIFLQCWIPYPPRQGEDNHSRISLSFEYNVGSAANERADASNVGRECHAQLQSTREPREFRVLSRPLFLPLSSVHQHVQRFLLSIHSAHKHSNHDNDTREAILTVLLTVILIIFHHPLTLWIQT